MSSLPHSIVRVLTVSLALTVVAAAQQLDADPKSEQMDPWRIQLSSSKKIAVFDQDGTQRLDRPSKRKQRPWSQPSPDGSLIVYADTSDGDAEIFVVDSDGKNPKKLTDNRVDDGFPSWSPDGRQIAFASNRNGRWQIHIMDRDGNNATQFTNEKLGAMYPKYGPEGQIAYHALQGGEGKLPPVNLVVANRLKEQQVVVNGARIVEFAWSPDGGMIAYSECGSLVFHHMKTGKTNEVVFKDIDPLLSSHSALDITWRPDSRAVACRISFVGGRSAIRGSAPDYIFGDNELFIIPIEGDATWFKPENEMFKELTSIVWIRD